jgi:hypothetical protein
MIFIREISPVLRLCLSVVLARLNYAESLAGYDIYVTLIRQGCEKFWYDGTAANGLFINAMLNI